MSCVVAPGFELADFEMGKREILLAEFPQHTSLIERLTRSKGSFARREAMWTE